MADEEKPPAPRPAAKTSAPAPAACEQGADSQLHCYNAVSWRLAEMFGDDEDTQPGTQK